MLVEIAGYLDADGIIKHMFFTRIGKIIAHIIFWPSMLRLVHALSIAFFSPDKETTIALVRRYLGSGTVGEYIDKAAILILIAVALGILAEISANKKKQSADS